jgi:tetratricopeptide (TPR) repeat protein
VLPQHSAVVEAMDRESRTARSSVRWSIRRRPGAAEFLFGLGTSLGRQGGEDLALAYLQLAIYLAPDHPLALMSLADLYESMKKPALALKVYQRVPADSPLQRNAEIQLATNLDALERTDEAKKILEKLISEQPTISKPSWRSAMSCASRKEFADCADVYARRSTR